MIAAPVEPDATGWTRGGSAPSVMRHEPTCSGVAAYLSHQAPAYNLGNFLLALATLEPIKERSLTQLPTPNFWARVLRFQARVSRIV